MYVFFYAEIMAKILQSRFNCDIRNKERLLKVRIKRFFGEKGKIKIYSDISLDMYYSEVKMHIILLLKNFQESELKNFREDLNNTKYINKMNLEKIVYF